MKYKHYPKRKKKDKQKAYLLHKLFGQHVPKHYRKGWLRCGAR